MTIAQMQEKRGTLLTKIKGVRDKATGESRALTPEENDLVTNVLKELDDLKAQIATLQKIEDVDAEMNSHPGRRSAPSNFLTPGIEGAGEQKELRSMLGRYSLLRAIRLQADKKPLDGVEKEVSDELARRSGKEAKGFFVPMQLPTEARALTTTTASGAIDKLTDHGNMIELLRNRTVLNALGARFIGDLVGEVDFPKQTGASTAYWVTEGNAPTGSNQTVGQVQLRGKTVGAYTDITRKLLRQTSMDAEAMVRTDLATVLALEIDRAAINGSGSGAEPTGLLQNGGVTTVALGTNGLAPTFAAMVAMESTVAAANADIGNLGYLTTAQGRGKLKVTEKATNTAQFIWGPDNTVNGYSAFASQQVPSNLTKGSGTGLSAVIFGNWSDLMVAQFGALDLMVDPYTLSSSGGIRVVVLQDVDIKTRNDASFCKITDMITA